MNVRWTWKRRSWVVYPFNPFLLFGVQVIVADNYFTGSKDNLSKWIGHPRFELIRHGRCTLLFFYYLFIYYSIWIINHLARCDWATAGWGRSDLSPCLSCFSNLLQVQPSEGKMSHCIQGVHKLIEKFSVLYLLFTVVVCFVLYGADNKNECDGHIEHAGTCKKSWCKVWVFTLSLWCDNRYHYRLSWYDPGHRILLTSTSEVYGDPLEHPQTEEYWGNVNPIGRFLFLWDGSRFAFGISMSPNILVTQKFSLNWFFYDFAGVRSCYDEGKRVAETLMFDYHRQHGLGKALKLLLLQIAAGFSFWEKWWCFDTYWLNRDQDC